MCSGAGCFYAFERLLGTDAHCLTFWWRSAAMTTALPWTSVGVATGYRGNRRVSTARATAHGASTADCHGCGHGTCRGSVRGKLRGTNHVNPRKSAAIATAISADVKPQQFPRPSAAIRGHCHGNPLIRGNCHGNPRPLSGQISADVNPQHFVRPSAAIDNYHGSPRQLPRQFPWTSNHSNFHGHPRQSSDTRQLPRKSTAIVTAISTEFQGHPRQLNCHVNRRQFPCNHGSYNGNPG